MDEEGGFMVSLENIFWEYKPGVQQRDSRCYSPHRMCSVGSPTRFKNKYKGCASTGETTPTKLVTERMLFGENRKPP